MFRAAPLAPVLLLLVALHGCSSARSTPALRPASMPTRHVLANGVRVVVQEQRASSVVALQLWVAAGGRDEAPSELGLAHYLEHMVFKGTSTRPLGAIDREVESVGGRINAATSLDYTYYHMLVPVARAAAGIDILADVAVNASLDAGALEREKLVVLEEMRRADDNPGLSLLRRLYTLVFDGHPYGRPVIGTPDLVRGLTREGLAGFYRRHYTPRAFTLVVVGPVTPAEVVSAATHAFSFIPRGGTDRLPVAPAPPAAWRTVEVTRPGAHAYLALGWTAPRLDHVDTPAMDLLVTILGQMPSSRLPRSLRDRLSLVNSISSGYSPLEAGGIVSVSAQVEAGTLARAEAEILAEIRRVQTEGVTDAELRRAITHEEADYEFSYETAEGRARRLGRAETMWRVEDELAYVNRLRAVTREQIRAAARRYLDLQRYARVAFVPGPRP
ncbi:MAG TPA: pitrilysin family protein [Methylomirabilota bacterium]